MRQASPARFETSADSAGVAAIPHLAGLNRALGILAMAGDGRSANGEGSRRAMSAAAARARSLPQPPRTLKVMSLQPADLMLNVNALIRVKGLVFWAHDSPRSGENSPGSVFKSPRTHKFPYVPGSRHGEVSPGRGLRPAPVPGQEWDGWHQATSTVSVSSCGVPNSAISPSSASRGSATAASRVSPSPLAPTPGRS